MALAAKLAKTARRKPATPRTPDSAPRRPAVLDRLPDFARRIVASAGGIETIAVHSPFDDGVVERRVDRDGFDASSRRDDAAREIRQAIEDRRPARSGIGSAGRGGLSTGGLG